MFTTSGARKKKSITDSIDILPPVDNLRKNVKKKQIILSKPPLPVSKNVEESTQPISNSTVNIGNRKEHISIKNILIQQKKEKNANKHNEKLPSEPIIYENLCLFWNQYAYQMKDRGLETFYNALIKKNPIELNSSSYAMEVDNEVQIEYIRPKLNDLLVFLQKNLKNYSLRIELKVTEQENDSIKFKTGKEKFDHMASKNPSLHVFRSVFNLDIEL